MIISKIHVHIDNGLMACYFFVGYYVALLFVLALINIRCSRELPHKLLLDEYRRQTNQKPSSLSYHTSPVKKQSEILTIEM